MLSRLPASSAFTKGERKYKFMSLSLFHAIRNSFSIIYSKKEWKTRKNQKLMFHSYALQLGRDDGEEGKANDLFVQSSVNSSSFSPSSEIRIIHKSFRDHGEKGRKVSRKCPKDTHFMHTACNLVPFTDSLTLISLLVCRRHSVIFHYATFCDGWNGMEQWRS
jgi:hypothetical protein